MTKSIELISDAIHNPKHPFRQVDGRLKKNLKHRYERRKIRECLHLGVHLVELSDSMGG